MLTFSSSSTARLDSREAVAECLENALGARKKDCGLVIFYTGMGHNFNDILVEARKLCPRARLVGSTCAGVIGREGPNESMRALGIMAIVGPQREFAVAGMKSIVGQDPFEVGAQLARELKNETFDITMVLFHPSLLDILPADRALRGIESVLPGVSIFGSLSLDNMKFVSNFQFKDDCVFERGAVAVGFADPSLEVVMQADHGFTVLGDPFVVTRSSSNLVHELDRKPAWRSLTERLGVQESIQPSEIAAFAVLAEEMPAEIQEEYRSRYIVRGGALKDSKGSLTLTAACPEGSRLWLMKRDEQKLFQGVDRLIERVSLRCTGRKPLAVFHADCAVRGRLSLNRILKDEIVRRMQYPLCRDENIPWLGMYGGGELTMLEDKNQIHTYTTSLFVLLKQNGRAV
jgi:hypothetical protein